MSNDDLFVCLDHVGYAVPNLDDAIKFHCDVMGWRLLHRETNEEQGVEEAMLGTGSQGPENAQVQLLAPLSETSNIGKFLAKSGPGVQQVCYRTNDVVRVAEVLSSRGVRMLYPEPKTGTKGSKINFAHPKDTGGILLEIVQPGQD